MTKASLALAATILGLCLSNLPAQGVDNPDFAKGKTGWQGDGKVVYFATDGSISETASPGATPGLKVELSKNAWREVHQSLRPKQKDTEIQYSVQVMAEPSFVRLPESGNTRTSIFSKAEDTSGARWSIPSATSSSASMTIPGIIAPAPWLPSEPGRPSPKTFRS